MEAEDHSPKIAVYLFYVVNWIQSSYLRIFRLESVRKWTGSIWELILSRMSAACVYYVDYSYENSFYSYENSFFHECQLHADTMGTIHMRIHSIHMRIHSIHMRIHSFENVSCLRILWGLLSGELIFANFWLGVKVDAVDTSIFESRLHSHFT